MPPGVDPSTALRVLLDLLPIGVMITRDGDTDDVEVNEAAARMLGLGEQGGGLRDAVFKALRDGRPIGPDEHPIRQALATGRPQGDVSVEVRRPDGSTAHLLKRAAPLRDAQGRVVGAVAVLVDQTHRVRTDERLRESEARYRRLYESSQVGIAFYHEDGRLEEPNDALLQMLQMPRAVFEREGLNWRQITPPGWEEADARGWEELRRTGRCVPFEKQFRRRDGSLVPVLVSGANLLPDRPEHGVALFVDLSRQKAAEYALRTLNETLERRVAQRTAESDARAEQLRGLALALADAEARERKRLAQLLHDHFQQLLSAAKLKAGLVRRTLGDAPAKANVEQIEKLLDAAIAESRSLISDLSPPVLYDAGLCAALDATVRSMAKRYGLRIEFECDPAVEPESEQVRVLLFESARELLSNVCRHANASVAIVKLGLTTDRRVRLTVADDGQGFDPQSLGAGNASPGDDAPSRRFGLMEISERLQYIGGTLDIHSEIGRGTHAEITLATALRQTPVHSTTPGEADCGECPTGLASNGDAGASPPRAAVDAPPERVTRVVVADDHAIFRDGLISLLGHEPGIRVVGAAADGEEAVAIVRGVKPDLLIVDVSMPKLNGLEVTRILAAEFPGLKIVGLSMHEREDMARAMRSAGAAAYLTKGGASENLLRVLRQLSIGSATAS